MGYPLQMGCAMLSAEHFGVKFTSREVSAWGGLALLKKMMDGMGVFQAIQSWQLPMPGSNRGYAPAQLLEQMIVSIWCGANRFVHSDITPLDKTLARLFGWSRVAEHKSIIRLFQCFDQSKATKLQHNCFNWHSPNFVDTLHNAISRLSNSRGLSWIQISSPFNTHVQLVELTSFIS